jgi:hypothetical protein
MTLDQFVLMPEVLARKALRNERIAFSVLAPIGRYAGVGTLRVLRCKQGAEQAIELICGYESYDQLA